MEFVYRLTVAVVLLAFYVIALKLGYSFLAFVSFGMVSYNVWKLLEIGADT